jgi:hypothetical protein
MMINEDVWFEIIQFLDIQTIGSLLVTSTTYNTISKQEHIWTYLIQRDFEQELQNNYNQIISLTTIDSYKYLYIHFKSFPYIFPPNVPAVSTSHCVLKVLIACGDELTRSMLWTLFSDGIWDDKTLHYIIGLDYKCLMLLPKKMNDTENVTYKVQLWTLSGNTSFKNISISYLTGVQHQLVVTGFDIADSNNTLTVEESRNSLSDALYWIEESSRFQQNTPIYLIGIGKTGNEITSDNVTKQDIVKYCRNKGICYFEIRKETRIHDVSVILNNLHLSSKHQIPANQIITQNEVSKPKICCMQ